MREPRRHQLELEVTIRVGGVTACARATGACQWHCSGKPNHAVTGRLRLPVSVRTSPFKFKFKFILNLPVNLKVPPPVALALAVTRQWPG